MAITIWRDEIFTSLKNDLVSSALTLILRDRRGDVINTRLISGLAQCFCMLKNCNGLLKRPQLPWMIHATRVGLRPQCCRQPRNST